MSQKHETNGAQGRGKHLGEVPLDVNVLQTLLQERHQGALDDVGAVDRALGQHALVCERERRVAEPCARQLSGCGSGSVGVS